MYVSLGSASPEVLAKAKAALPRCYSQEYSESCENDRKGSYPGCASLWSLYDADHNAYENLISSIPHCSEKLPLLPMLAAGVGGIATGVLISYLFRAKLCHLRQPASPP